MDDSSDRPTGGARPKTTLPATLAGYVWQASGRHQIALALLSVLVFLLSAAPLEFQRRIVNEAIHDGIFAPIAWLAAGYAAVALAEGGLKLAMNVYRSWISESTVRHLRQTVCNLPPVADGRAAAYDGVELSMILSEVEPIGGFVGVSTSEPLLQGGILVSVFGYMVYLQPEIAMVSLLVFSPQLLFVPLLQKAINRRVRGRISVMRDVSGSLITHPVGEAAALQARRIQQVFQLNMGVFRLKFTMNFLMNLMHHIGVAAILAVGGWYAATGRIEIGTVVAFVSGLTKVNDPWGDIVNWFRDLNVNAVKYKLVADAIEQLEAASETTPVP